MKPILTLFLLLFFGTQTVFAQLTIEVESGAAFNE